MQCQSIFESQYFLILFTRIKSAAQGPGYKIVCTQSLLKKSVIAQTRTLSHDYISCCHSFSITFLVSPSCVCLCLSNEKWNKKKKEGKRRKEKQVETKNYFCEPERERDLTFVHFATKLICLVRLYFSHPKSPKREELVWHATIVMERNFLLGENKFWKMAFNYIRFSLVLFLLLSWHLKITWDFVYS